MNDVAIALNRASVVEAVTDYILQVNQRGYRLDRKQALSMRKTERTAALRDAVTPVRGEVHYFVEGHQWHEPLARKRKMRSAS